MQVQKDAKWSQLAAAVYALDDFLLAHHKKLVQNFL